MYINSDTFVRNIKLSDIIKMKKKPGFRSKVFTDYRITIWWFWYLVYNLYKNFTNGINTNILHLDHKTDRVCLHRNKIMYVWTLYDLHH